MLPPMADLMPPPMTFPMPAPHHPPDPGFQETFLTATDTPEFDIPATPEPSLPSEFSIEFCVYTAATYSITLLCYCKRFVLEVSVASVLEDPVVSMTFRRLLRESRDKLAAGQPEDEQDLSAVSRWVISLCNETMKSLACTQSWDRILTIEHWLDCETTNIQMKAFGGQMICLPYAASSSYFRSMMPSLLLPSSNFLSQAAVPAVHPSKLFLQPLPGPKLPSLKKLIDFWGEPFMFKLQRAFLEEDGLRELSIRIEIRQKMGWQRFRVPMLRGVVCAAGNGSKIYGQLLQYVEKSRSLSDVRDYESMPEGRATRFAEQLRSLVELLHNEGIIWGSAHPESVLVDKNDDLWINDFSRRYVQDWIEPGKEGTVEGDCQAVNRMCGWLMEAISDSEDASSEEGTDGAEVDNSNPVTGNENPAPEAEPAFL
jgi:hypothetical protein